MSAVSMKDVIVATRDRLLKIPVPVAFVDTIGVELSGCAGNLTKIIAAIDAAEKEETKADAV